MKLPNSSKASIPEEKLIDYVLSETHYVGKFKAKFFSKLGFDAANINFFKKSLLKIAKTEEVTDEIVTPYGTKYILDGALGNPLGRKVKVRTLWIIEKGKSIPRFITVYPV